MTKEIRDKPVSGIVYHANYLRFMGRARSDMLRLSGIDQRARMEVGGGACAVIDLAIKYRLPAKLDDDFVVVSHMVIVRAASCTIHQRVMRDNDILSDAKVVAALVAPNDRPMCQPREWIDTFKRLKTGE